MCEGCPLLGVVICFQFSIFEPLDTTETEEETEIECCDLLSI